MNKNSWFGGIPPSRQREGASHFKCLHKQSNTALFSRRVGTGTSWSRWRSCSSRCFPAGRGRVLHRTLFPHPRTGTPPHVVSPSADRYVTAKSMKNADEICLHACRFIDFQRFLFYNKAQKLLFSDSLLNYRAARLRAESAFGTPEIYAECSPRQ